MAIRTHLLTIFVGGGGGITAAKQDPRQSDARTHSEGLRRGGGGVQPTAVRRDPWLLGFAIRGC